jgi:hypothetical protein
MFRDRTDLRLSARFVFQRMTATTTSEALLPSGAAVVAALSALFPDSELSALKQFVGAQIDAESICLPLEEPAFVQLAEARYAADAQRDAGDGNKLLAKLFVAELGSRCCVTRDELLACAERAAVSGEAASALWSALRSAAGVGNDRCCDCSRADVLSAVTITRAFSFATLF